MQITPINMAEGIFEPFWDPQLSGLRKWRLKPYVRCGLNVFQNWCWVGFEWTRKPKKGPVLSMSRRVNVRCKGYDKLVVSLTGPERSILCVSAITDKREVTFHSAPFAGLRQECVIDLKGAKKIESLTLEIEAADDGQACGWFNWIGLQNTKLLKRYLAGWNRFDMRWEGYLQDEKFEPIFNPSYEILIGRKELRALRTKHAGLMKKYGRTPFTEAAKLAQKFPPEKMIGEHVNFWGDTRYNRERNDGKYVLDHGVNAAIAGMLLKDKKLLRLAARYAMSIAMCVHWDDGMITCFPGGTFDHRCFVQSLCLHDLALILDLAGEMFTKLGREFILRRMAEEGQAAITFNTWKYEYIFDCNQLAWFTPGRISGYLVQERHWPRVKPYRELAYEDLVESLQKTILPDGGYVEGPSYFTCVGRNAGLSMWYYAKAEGMSLGKVIPPAMRRCGDFAAALISTDQSQDVIPICDAGTIHNIVSQAIMATILPQTQWVTMFRKTLDRSKGVPEQETGLKRVPHMGDNLLAWHLAERFPKKVPDLPSFVFLPDMGTMASTRLIGKEIVKLLIIGNKAGAGHTHEDKGSFVLEFAGDTFATDPGSCDYSSPFSNLYKNCERHNMLVPFGTIERPHPLSPIPMDVKPHGRGGKKHFTAAIELTSGWESYYKKWERMWDSPMPDTLTIRDTYKLVRGSGVRFYWQTRLPVKVKGNIITITGRRGVVKIEAPGDCTVHVDRLRLYMGETQQRIAICKDGTSGTIEVRATLTVKP